MNGFRPEMLIALAASIIFFSGCDVSNSSNNGSQDADPVVEDFPIAFIQRPLPVDENGEPIESDVLDPSAFNPGARLIYKDRASVPANDVIISDAAFAIEPTPDPDNPDAELTAIIPDYDVKDLEVSADGTKLLFAMRAPEIEDSAIQPTWNIWEYNLETEILRPLIESDLIADEGEDVAPAYLPDGRIIFSSTRQRRSRAVLLDENKPQFSALSEDGETEAFSLHIMDEDGDNIQQITFNQSHDLHPTVLNSGEILYLRWDNFSDQKDRLSLYKANPDGSTVNLIYGYHSQDTGSDGSEATFFQPRELEDGTILVNLRQRATDQWGGDLVRIDAEHFSDNEVAIDNSSTSENAQVSLIPRTIVTNGAPSPDGLYNSAYPINDGTERILLSWSPCYVEGVGLGIYVNANRELVDEQGQYVSRNGDILNEGQAPTVVAEEEVGAFPCNDRVVALEDIQIAQPSYGIWIYDPKSDTSAPVVLAEENMMYVEALVIEERPTANFIADLPPNTALDEGVGVLNIRSTYDVDGEDVSPNGISDTSDPSITSAQQRPARFLRVMKAVSRPDDEILDIDEGDFGNINRMREILGYAPIEPDGSVAVQVPADVALTFSIVNGQGKRISPDGARGEQHENWISVRSGEVYECKGCHEGEDSQTPHGRRNAGPESIYAGASTGVMFANTTLRDAFGTIHPFTPEEGETMAEFYTRMNGDAPRVLSMNMVDNDDWQDDGLRPRTPIVDIQYANLPASVPAPTDCLNQWNSLCRTIINYEEHIQAIWLADRPQLDASGNEVANNKCTFCHSSVDENGIAQIPAGEFQLDLSDSQSVENPAHLTSFDELFRSTPVLEVNSDGLLQPETVHLSINGVLQFEARDAEDNRVPAPADNSDSNITLLTDANGQLIPFIELTGATIGPVMNRNGALRNATFFNIFEIGGGTVDHSTFLNSAELKLIAEWLDIGGQYFNNPFDAPQD